MEAAPFFADVASDPEGVDCRWLRTADGVRIRIGIRRGGTQGTVLIYPGRTEFIEKYTHVAAAVAAMGYASVIVDWRGQGLADRPLADPRMGHVARFADYQQDVTAVTDAALAAGLPAPLFLVAHSMGGCIALRALMDGILPARAVAFTGPMWGIRIAPALRPVAWGVGIAAQAAQRAEQYAPTTGPMTYVAVAPFADNTLTRDPDMYALMQRQVREHPELSLGGPSVNWLIEGLRETRALALRPSPAIPCLTALGGAERVVETARVRSRMDRWPGGALDVYPEAEHEILVERPHHRARFFESARALFAAHAA